MIVDKGQVILDTIALDESEGVDHALLETYLDTLVKEKIMTYENMYFSVE